MAAPRVAAATPTRLRVPFTIGDVYGGWARADGILRFDGQTLVLEFQVKDEVVGCVSSAVKNVAVPVAEIVSLDWVPGWFAARATLELRVDRLETLQRVPRSERGCVRLRMARADAPAAQQLLDAVRDADRPAGAGYAAAIPAETASRSLDPSRRDRAAQDVRGPATGLLIVGALDCATVLLLLVPLLVITDVHSVPQASPRDTRIEVVDPMSKERAYSLLSSAQEAGKHVLVEKLGPESHHVTVSAQPPRSAEVRQPTMGLSLGVIALVLGLIPLVSGLTIMLGALRIKHLKSYELGIAAAILAIVPLHPWAVLGVPIGIWTLIVLHRSDVKTLFAERARRPAPASGPGQDRVRGGLLPMVVVVLGLLMVSALVAVGRSSRGTEPVNFPACGTRVPAKMLRLRLGAPR